MTQAKYLFRKIQHAFGQDTLSADRAVISAIETQPRTALTTAELHALTEQLGAAVIDKTEEQMEREWYLHRGYHHQFAPAHQEMLSQYHE